MRDLLNWNLSLGRWAGVQVRLHVFFLLFALFVVYESGRAPGEAPFWYVLMILAVWLASLLLHEFAHCLAARRMGGQADQVLVWPLGGLTQVHTTHEPGHELATAIAGPAANLLVCLATAPLLIGTTDSPADLINPLNPPSFEGNPDLAWHNAAAGVFWINWVLLIFNMLPAYPLDGGRLLRGALSLRQGYRPSGAVMARVAKVTAVALCVTAWLLRDEPSAALLLIVVLGIFLFFSARQEGERLHEQDPEDALFGYDFSQGYTSLEKTLAPPRKRGPGPVRKWLDTRRANRLLRQQQIEADEERRVDEVLARLHQAGLDALSPDDRALLDRVSARYRNRQRG